MSVIPMTRQRKAERVSLQMRHEHLSRALDHLAEAIGSVRATRHHLLVSMRNEFRAWSVLVAVEADLERLYERVRRHARRLERELATLEAPRRARR